MESVLSYHSTGRLAAMFRVNYPDPGPRALAGASRRFLEDPPAGSADAPLLTDRGLLWVADEIQVPGLERGRGGGADPSAAGSRLLSAKEVNDMAPVMRREKRKKKGWGFQFIASGLSVSQAQQVGVTGMSLNVTTRSTTHTARRATYVAAAAANVAYFNDKASDIEEEKEVVHS
ncbi:MAG: FAD-dependent oxidoreductase [bacterium]|nr:hypothetical protein [Acidimicrobiia bacterium]MCY4651023.1 FAD-dependent oxidoreductase [bacterium]